MLSNFVEKINSLMPEQKLHFYELLAHRLTLSIRGVWSDSNISDTEKVDQIRWINEVMHRVTAKVYVLRLNKNAWTEEDMWKLIEWAVSQNTRINVHISSAVMESYNQLLLM